jgi:Domain of unknown function (DUF3850)
LGGEETEMKMIEIKTVNPYFTDTWNGDKPVEIRLNDRNYQVGDILWQREYDPEEAKIMGTGYSGREILSQVTKILIEENTFQGLAPGYLMMAIKILQKR